MAYMRGDIYVWGDGRNLHLWVRRPEDAAKDWATECEFAAGVAIPDAIMDDLAVMIVAELERAGRLKAVQKRAMRKWGGNFGAYALVEKVTGKPFEEWWKKRAAAREKRGHEGSA